MIQERYDEMWKKFTAASESNNFELDNYLLHPENDTRRGITTLAYLKQNDTSALLEIEKFQNAIKAIEPNQYYHPIDELHLTILPVISCLKDFTLAQIIADDYKEVFLQVFSQTKPIEIKYQGITASSNCIMIQGFPLNDSLENLRNALRNAWFNAGLKINIDTRYKLVTAHSSAIRFCVPVTDAKRLFNLCEQYRNHLFGKMIFTNFDLVFNNWYQNLSITKTLSQVSVRKK